MPPASTDAILVTVRADQVNAELASHLEAAKHAPIVMLTPMLPGVRDVLEGALGRTVVPAMPGVVGYENDAGAVRYWIVKAQATLIEEGLTPKERNVRGELARNLSRAGIIARVEENVGTTNAATTAAFFPFVLTIAAAGSTAAALPDKHQVSLMLDAAKEADAIAKTLGHVVSTAGVLMKFVGPFTLKAGVSLAKRVSPEAVHFIEQHFGPKLQTQHVAMGNALLEVAREHQIATPALRALLDLVVARATV